MDLPFELLDAIISYLKDKKDLQAVRLVNKGLSEIGAPHLFASVEISTLNAAKLRFQDFGQHIKTVTIAPELVLFPPRAFQKKRFQRRLRQLRGHKVLRYTRVHMEHIHKVHETFCEERECVIRSKLPVGELGPLLLPLLQQAPKLERVRFLKSSTRIATIMAKVLSKSCTEPECVKLQRLQFASMIKNSAIEADGVTEQFQIMLNTLSKAQTRLRHLEIRDSRRGDDQCLQRLHIPDNTANVNHLLSNLTTVRLSLHLRDRQSPTIATWLSVASPQLEKLWLEIPFPYYTYIGTARVFETFTSCHFPKLRVLLLCGFDSRDTDLVNFVQQCDQLEELKIVAHQLDPGTWSDVVSRIVSATKLKLITDGNDFQVRPTHHGLLRSRYVGIYANIEHELREEGGLIRDDMQLWFWGKPEPPTYQTLDPFINP